MQNSLVSIIIPTFNRADLITQTLDTVIAQTYTHWECIIVDDESTDNSTEILQKYIELDPRFQLHSRPKDRIKGANACRNYGFELSKGEFVKWFDSDDLMSPDFIEKQVGLLQIKEELDFCASLSEMFDVNNGGKWKNSPERIENENALFNYISGKLIFLTPAPLWRKDYLVNKILFDEELKNAHEADFNFKRLIEGANFEYIQEILFYVRRGHESIDFMSVSNPDSFRSMLVYYQKVYDYLCCPSNYLTDNERYILRKSIIYRQNSLFYSLRFLQSRSKSHKNFCLLIRNVHKSKFSITKKIKLFSGLSLIYLFKKGYKFAILKDFKI